MKCSDKDLEIVYLDNHLIVVKKRGNLLTQENETSQENLTDLLKCFLKEKYQKKGDVFLHPIHRIDKSVSGLVLFAKTSKALLRLNEQVRMKMIVRKYCALVEGKLQKKEGTLTHLLVHDDHCSKIAINNKDAKKAELEYKVRSEKNNLSLVEINLLTGRYHQIRVQFSSIGHPIYGDKKYGSKMDLKEIALHGYYLEFLHPISKKKIELIWTKDLFSSFLK
jgi:23S rRNA pseudouridine1911/1915/1917 synthase